MAEIEAEILRDRRGESGARAAVLAEARSWLGTPYHHAADLKGVGVDCAMILVRVYCDAGLVEPFDPRPYTRDWMLHRSEERYLGFLLARAIEVARPQPADVILFRVGRCFAHGGIVTRAEPLTILHAFAPARMVIEEEIKAGGELADRLPTAKFADCFGHGASVGRAAAKAMLSLGAGPASPPSEAMP